MFIRYCCTFVSMQTGIWDNYLTWYIQGNDGELYPSPYTPEAGNFVRIQSGHNVTLTRNEQAKSISTHGTLTTAGHTLTVDLDPVVTSFQTRVGVVSGSLSGAELNALDYLVKELKAETLDNDLEIYSKSVDLMPVVGGNIAAALLKLKYPGAFSTAVNTGSTALVNGDYVANRGIVITATGRRIGTQVIPTANGLSYSNFYVASGVTTMSATAAATQAGDNRVSGNYGFTMRSASIGMDGGSLLCAAPTITAASNIKSISSNGQAIFKDNYANQLIIGAGAPATPATPLLDTEVSYMGARSNGSDTYGLGDFAFGVIASYLTDAEDAAMKKAIERYWTALGRKSTTKDVVMMGDSITFGAGATTILLNYAYLTAAAMSLKQVNCGMSGSRYALDTATLPCVYNRRFDTYKYNFLGGGYYIITAGTNDMRLDTGNGTPATMADLTAKMIIHINEVLALGQPANKILVGGLPLNCETGTMTRQDNYNIAIQDACTATGATYVPHKSSMLATCTGTISIAASSQSGVGVGTSFLTELIIGSHILFGTVWYRVTAIADNTHLTVSVVVPGGYTNIAITATSKVGTDKIHPLDAGHLQLKNNYIAAM